MDITTLTIQSGREKELQPMRADVGGGRGSNPEERRRRVDAAFFLFFHSIVTSSSCPVFMYAKRNISLDIALARTSPAPLLV